MMGFVVALIILLVIGVAAVRDSARLSALNSEVNLTHQIIADIKDVLACLTDSETGVRGYALTRNRDFLQPFETGQARLGPILENLQENVQDPEAVAILEDFVLQVRARNQRFGRAVALVDDPSTRRETLLAGVEEGKRAMDQVRVVAGRLQQLELQRLRARTEEARQLSSRTNVVVATGSTLAIIFLAIASLIVIRDVKARTQIEEQLRETTTLQRAILDSANYSIVSVDPNGIIRTFNTAAQKWLQYEAAEVIGKHTPELFHDRAEIEARAEVLSKELGRPVAPGFETFVAKARSGKLDEMEWTYIRKDGSRFPVLLSITVLYDTWGQVTGFMGVASDITARKQAEEALRKAEETFRTLLQESSDIVVILTPEGVMRYVSPAVERLVGYKVDHLTGGNVFEYIHADDVGQARESLRNTSQTPGYAVPLELRLRRPDGSYVWIELIANNLLHDPHIQGVVINARDVTTRHEMEQMKRDFISTVSHELRTPLTSIHGALGLLASGKLGDVPVKGQRMLEIAVKNTDRLVRLVNDILDIERMDSGAIRMEMKPVDAGELLSHSADVMRSMAEAAGVQLKVAAHNVTIHADSDRLTQMFTNLLSNAIKFSPRGGVVRLGAEQKGRLLHFTVSDQGRGIPQNKLESIFERFQQVDASDSREKGGTGLGLSICRLIARQHGGRIWAESTLDHGSTFHVELPLRTAERRPLEEEVERA